MNNKGLMQFKEKLNLLFEKKLWPILKGAVLHIKGEICRNFVIVKLLLTVVSRIHFLVCKTMFNDQ